MRKLLFAMISVLITATSIQAQYYNDDPIGTTYEYEINNALAGKSSVVYKLLSAKDGVITYQLTTTVPGQDTPIVTTSKITYADQRMIPDIDNLLQETKKGLGANLGTEDLDVKIDGDTGYIPLQGKKGDKHPLFTYTTTAKASGVTINIKQETTENEIISEEALTTPAGNFQTFVQATESKMIISIMGMDQKVKQKQKLWIVPGKGIVKQEVSSMGQTYTTTLVKITRP